MALVEPQPLDGGDEPCFEGVLELEQGPERIETGWWDGRDVPRDYYVARNPAGVRLWVFRERRRRAAGFCMACLAERTVVRRRVDELRGTALPDELQFPAGRFASGGAGRARGGLGYAALAITDECSVAGVVRAHVAARERALPLIVGSEFASRTDHTSCCLRPAAMVMANSAG